MEAACLTHTPSASQFTILKSRSVSLRATQCLGSRVQNPWLQSFSEKRKGRLTVAAVDNSAKKVVPNSNYVVPLDNPPASSCITRPLAEILRDLNKRVPDKVVKGDGAVEPKYIPWVRFTSYRMPF
eukprot:Gb_02077 [translate_table: standard]